MRVLQSVAAAVVIALFSLGAFAQSAWLGNYVFEENGGKTAGGTVIYVSHEIQITEGEDGLLATVTANGYQTSRDLLCTVKPVKDGIELIFESYGENNVLEPFEPGESMLTLTRGKKGELLTSWGNYRPVVKPNEVNLKPYFIKVPAK